MKKRILYNLILTFLLFWVISATAQPTARERVQAARENARSEREKERQENMSGRGLPPRQTSTIVEDETIHDGKTLVMLTPQFLYVKQLRIEIDKKIAHRHWLSFSPHYVQYNQEYQTHWGFGTGATYKYFINEESPVYVGGGLQFTHHVFENSGFDDLPQADEWLYKTNITQYGINAIIGSYIRFTNRIYGDIYAGFGYRMSSTKTTDDVPHEFSTLIFTMPDSFIFGPFRNKSLFSHNHAYQGPVFVFGIRFGIML
ncbi:MAG: hypothetical protein LBP96_00350 [Bacteroidales bacterium]|jgi:hypothetical protein|nr:hypothetical protein [Bacteroidales bacterium]